MADGVKPRVKVPKSASAGETITIKTLISHTMESGQRKDKQGNVIPRSIIHRFTCESAVEINKMQPIAPGFDKVFGLCCRVIVEHRGLIHIAMHEPHSVSVFQINGGVKDHVGAPAVSRVLSP